MAVRIKCQVRGDGGDPDIAGNPTQITLQGSLALADHGDGTTILNLFTTAVANLFANGQLVNIYIALNPTEIGQIEASGATITPATNAD